MIVALINALETTASSERSGSGTPWSRPGPSSGKLSGTSRRGPCSGRAFRPEEEDLLYGDPLSGGLERSG